MPAQSLYSKITGFILLVCILSLPLSGIAQEVFSAKDKEFFKKQVRSMEHHLRELGVWGKERITQLDIKTIKLDNGNDCVFLILYPAQSNTWINLSDSYSQQFKRSLTEDIFEKLLFLCEIPPTQALVFIKRKDVIGTYKLTAGLDPEKGYSFSEEEKFKKKNSFKAVVEETFELPKKLVIPSEEIPDVQSFQELRNKAETILKDYYKDKTAWGMQCKFKRISSYNRELRVKVSFIRQEVFTDHLYYELIYIKVKWKRSVDNKIEFECMVDGKYGTSILFEPRDSQFKDVSKQSSYQSYIDEYALKIRDLLYDQLK